MNMKKFFALLLTVVLCASFVACGGGSEADDTADADTIKIGFIGPLTGGTAQYGEAVRNGAQMYIDELNAAGGIDGKTVELIAMDSTGDATVAMNCYERLVGEEGVCAIVGPVLTGESLAVAELAAIDGIPMVTASATGDDVTVDTPSFFRTCYTDSTQGVKMAEYVANVLGLKKVAVLKNNSDDYSVGLAKAFVDKCAELGITVVLEESFAEEDTDFKSQLTNIAATDAEAIYAPIYYQKLALISQQAGEVNVSVPFLGGDGFDGVLAYEGVDTEGVEGAIFTNHFDAAASAEGAAFLADYSAEFGVAPMSFSFLAYDAAKVITDAIANAGSTDAEAIVDAIASGSFDCLTSAYTFDEYGNAIKDCAIIKVTAGEYAFQQMF